MVLPEPPTIKEWIDIVNNICLKEKITVCLRLQKNVFVKLWTKWVEYVKPLRPEFVEVLEG